MLDIFLTLVLVTVVSCLFAWFAMSAFGALYLGWNVVSGFLSQNSGTLGALIACMVVMIIGLTWTLVPRKKRG